MEQNIEKAALSLKASPNPSSSYFNLAVNSANNTEAITILIFDDYGRTIEVLNKVKPGAVLRVGNNYRSGIYFAEMIQGTQRVNLKLIK